MYLLTSLHHEQYATRGHFFLSRVQLVWIQFSFSKLESPVCLTILLKGWMEYSTINTIPKSVSFLQTTSSKLWIWITESIFYDDIAQSAAPLQRGKTSHPMSVLDMILNNLMVRFQWCWSFGECKAPLHCYCFQVHSGPAW